MNVVVTMAIQINEDTYPIAVACLPAGFATLPFEDVDESVLIINELDAVYNEGSNRPALEVGNAWCSKEYFERAYRFLTPERKTRFTPVESIKWVEDEEETLNRGTLDRYNRMSRVRRLSGYSTDHDTGRRSRDGI